MSEMTFKHKSAEAEVWLTGANQATVANLYSRERGKNHAKELMKQICAWADEAQLELYLSAAPYGDQRPRLEQFELIVFYLQFGFQSANNIYPEDMYRKPTPS